MKRARPGRTDVSTQPRAREPVVLVAEVPEPEEAAAPSGPPVFPEEQHDNKADDEAEEPEMRRCSYCSRLRPVSDFYSATMCFGCRAQ